MIDVEFYERSIFTAYDMPAYLIVKSDVDFMLKAYEDSIIYIDDTLTGTIRRAGTQLIRLWDYNAHGDPSTGRGIYTVTVELYDSGGRLLLTKKLKYLYDRYAYLVSFVDETGSNLGVDMTIMLARSLDVFFIQRFADKVELPPLSAGDKLVIEAYRVKDGNKYMYVAVNPTLAQSTTIKLTPNSANAVTVVYDISQLGWLSYIPGSSTFISFLSWVSAGRIPYIVADWISRQLGITNAIIDVRVDGNYLYVTYENDPVPILAAILFLAKLFAAVFIVYLLVNAFVAYISYETQKLVTEQNRQYYEAQKSVLQYAKEKGLTPQETQRLMEQVKPPQVSSTAAEQMTNTIEQLKQMLLIAIGGAIVITVLSLARK